MPGGRSWLFVRQRRRNPSARTHRRRARLAADLRFDNGTEFTSALLQWGTNRDVALHFIDPGKPIQNPHIESINGRIRDELMNAHSFPTIFIARRLADEWPTAYNDVRPQSALG